MRLWPNRENLSWWEFSLTVLITLIIAAELALALYALQESRLQGEVLRDLKDGAERASRLNERPWMNISLGQGQLIDGQPLVMPVQITNSGKTPAKNVQGTIVLNLLHKGEEPDFVYETGHPRYAIDVGMMSPNFPNTPSWSVLPKHLLPSEPLKPIVVSSAIRKGISDGNLYVVMHGRITYGDIFGESHWMTFCSYAQNPPITGPDAAKCSQYNDTDKNDWRKSDAPRRATMTPEGQFWLNWWVNFAVAAGTLFLAAVALFGEKLRAKLFPPQLKLTIRAKGGEKTQLKDQSGTVLDDVRYYHLQVSNARRWSPAEQTQVFLTRIEEEGPSGDLQVKWYGNIPMRWRDQEFVPLLRTIGAPTDCDFCRVERLGGLLLMPLIIPHNLNAHRTGSCKFVATLQARSTIADSEVFRLRVAWDGQWEDGAEEMKQHFDIEAGGP